MTHTVGAIDTPDIGGLLAGADQVVTTARSCWLLLPSDGPVPSARPMGRPMRCSGEEWIFRFVTDGRSGKCSAVLRARALAVILQRETDDAFVVLSGNAALLSEPSEVRKHWRDGFKAYFPTEEDRANAKFIELTVTRMELWIRGVTPEPFGMRPSILERIGAGAAWRLRSVPGAM